MKRRGNEGVKKNKIYKNLATFKTRLRLRRYITTLHKRKDHYNTGGYDAHFCPENLIGINIQTQSTGLINKIATYKFLN
jgi:hypothetical protein